MGARKAINHEEAARVVKHAAQEQPIAIELTEEQMRALVDQWSGDPTKPALITFTVRERIFIELPVASCAYWSDTCCALPLPFRDKGDPPPDEMVTRDVEDTEE